MKVVVLGMLSLFSMFSGYASEVENYLTPSGVAPVKTERERLYEQVFEKQLNNLLSQTAKSGRKPKVGGPCCFEVVTGAVVKGTIALLTDSRVTVQEKYGKVTYPIHVMERKFWCVYFPKEAARMLTLRKMAEERKRKEAEEAKAARSGVKALVSKAAGTDSSSDALAFLDGNGAAEKQSETVRQADAAKPNSRKIGGICKYDPSPASTPDDLKVPLRELGQWIAYRASEMASSIYAKRHGDQVAVYVQATPQYQKLDPDARFTVTESMWNMWGFRCEDHQVAMLDKTHLVVLDSKGKIIGGSSPDEPSNIWIDKK